MNDEDNVLFAPMPAEGNVFEGMFNAILTECVIVACGYIAFEFIKMFWRWAR